MHSYIYTPTCFTSSKIVDHTIQYIHSGLCPFVFILLLFCMHINMRCVCLQHEMDAYEILKTQLLLVNFRHPDVVRSLE